MTLPKIIRLEEELYTRDFYKEFEDALDTLNVGTKFIPVCGTTYTKKITYDLIENLTRYTFLHPQEVPKPTADAAYKISNIAKMENAAVLGIGGGKIMDVAKKAASDADKPVVSVPTQPTHDGIASPVVSISAPRKPYSTPVKWPTGVIIPMSMMYNSSKEAISQGVGDCIAKITANLDWKLSSKLSTKLRRNKIKKINDPSYDPDISYLCRKPAFKLLRSVKKMKEEGISFPGNGEEKRRFISGLVDALVRYGKYMCIIESSVCASGGEHLWIHAIDSIVSKYIPHGWGTGSGTFIMLGVYKLRRPSYYREFYRKLHVDLNEFKELLHYAYIPSTSKELGITKEESILAFKKAVELGDERGRVTIFDDMRYRKPKIDINDKFVKKHLSDIGYIR